MVSVPQKDYMSSAATAQLNCSPEMVCLCSDRVEANQSSRTRQVLDAVSGLAVSPHPFLYSQRFNQVLLGARGRDLVSAGHAAATCCHNTRLNGRPQLRYKDIFLITHSYYDA